MNLNTILTALATMESNLTDSLVSEDGLRRGRYQFTKEQWDEWIDGEATPFEKYAGDPELANEVAMCRIKHIKLTLLIDKHSQISARDFYLYWKMGDAYSKMGFDPLKCTPDLQEKASRFALLTLNLSQI